MTKSILLVAIFASLFLAITPACQSENNDDSNDDNDTGCDDSDAPDGTWVDPETCRMWRIENNPQKWLFDSAKVYCESLKQGGFDDWRLPSISELRSLIRGCPATITGGECPLTDACEDWSECKDESCRGCEEGEGLNDGCYGPPELMNPCEWFWTANEDICMLFAVGGIVLCDTGDEEREPRNFVQCVRG